MARTAVLVDLAAYHARKAGCPSILREHLAKAADEIAVGAKRKLPNPFRVADALAGKPAPMSTLDGDDE